MTEAAKKARNAYLKKWRKANPDKTKAIRERYWEKRAAELEAAESSKASETLTNDGEGE
ncbi:MAG: hypothetical protein LUH43_04960 [Clostridia bacterium]|nr:hypothetical protein [Clostridia bacterium]